MVPTTKKDPGAWLLDVRVTMPELSVAVGSVQVTVVPATPVLTVWAMSLRQAMTGGIVSTNLKKQSISFNVLYRRQTNESRLTDWPFFFTFCEKTLFSLAYDKLSRHGQTKNTRHQKIL